LGDVGEGALLVLLPDEALHGTVYLIDVDGHLRLYVPRVEHFVRLYVPDAPHVLAKVSILCAAWVRAPCLDLGMIPLVHAQRLDLRDVRPQLPVEGAAAHAQKYAQLFCVSQVRRNIPTSGRHTLQLAHPVRRQSTVIV
jgi:hypothetical protein